MDPETSILGTVVFTTSFDMLTFKLALILIKVLGATSIIWGAKPFKTLHEKILNRGKTIGGPAGLNKKRGKNIKI